MKFVIEINKLQIVTSDKISHQELLKKTFRSRFSGEMLFKVKQTPSIVDDQDTICFMKYFLHNRVKKNLIKECKYDELMKVADLIEEFHQFEDLKGREVISEEATGEGEDTTAVDGTQEEGKFMLEFRDS